MDHLINVEKHTGLMCRRKVFDVSFNNDAASEKVVMCDVMIRTHLFSDSDHLDCNTDRPSGCDRCCLAKPTICCDIHHPNHFTQCTSHIEKTATMLPRSRIAKYEKTKNNFALQDVLDEWREQKTVDVYGWHHLNDLGPTIVMPNTMLDHVVDCAHHHKLQNIVDLKKETGWTDTGKFGEEVIALIKKYVPLPHSALFTATPLRLISTPITTPQLPTPVPAAVERRRNRCSACGLEGHNGMFSFFGQFLLHEHITAHNHVCHRHPSRSGPNKENIAQDTRAAYAPAQDICAA
ncbi:uncharacterized protein HD556DRAFT_1250440 [Suillus plorans]|uniref:Uncharacterized protein n=1 Tax=Suillus plorans TaxID=116603 RepID=A0A9P7AA19_9AGAM|nr:uncharacterized protein HD556DRAFT_1250440 [Suillus plorans]KAG1785091.1 hypothetical protein HD556DRAFT_1250440 [Suillus plorans]